MNFDSFLTTLLLLTLTPTLTFTFALALPTPELASSKNPAEILKRDSTLWCTGGTTDWCAQKWDCYCDGNGNIHAPGSSDGRHCTSAQCFCGKD